MVLRHKGNTVLPNKAGMASLRQVTVNSMRVMVSNRVDMASLLQVKGDTANKVATVNSREDMVSLKEVMEGLLQPNQVQADTLPSKAKAMALRQPHGTDKLYMPLVHLEPLLCAFG